MYVANDELLIALRDYYIQTYTIVHSVNWINLVTMFELDQTGSDMSDMSSIDNDVSELLRDSFGDPDQSGGSELELDKNLNDILEDLKKSVGEDLKNNNGKRSFQEVSSDLNQFADVQGLASPAPDDGYGDSLLEIHKDLEFEIESDRIERLRNPRFQTMPAFKKRAKQEAQWREAVSAARRAQSLSRGQGQQSKASTSAGVNECFYFDIAYTSIFRWISFSSHHYSFESSIPAWIPNSSSKTEAP